MLRESKSESKSTEERPKLGAKPATCNHPDGCGRPAGRVVAKTKPEHRGWCVTHRQRAQSQAWAARQKPAAKPATTKPAVTKPAPAPKERAPAARRQVEASRGAADLVVRALAVVDKLGGLERAERIAAAIGGA